MVGVLHPILYRPIKRLLPTQPSLCMGPWVLQGSWPPGLGIFGSARPLHVQSLYLRHQQSSSPGYPGLFQAALISSLETVSTR